ncbi:MAG: hypothetical protein JKY23_00345 [Nitrospinaceae bacterium]|nr:hypothetical protein [Nitrospinaceae bacterium]
MDLQALATCSCAWPGRVRDMCRRHRFACHSLLVLALVVSVALGIVAGTSKPPPLPDLGSHWTKPGWMWSFVHSDTNQRMVVYEVHGDNHSSYLLEARDDTHTLWRMRYAQGQGTLVFGNLNNCYPVSAATGWEFLNWVAHHDLAVDLKRQGWSLSTPPRLFGGTVSAVDPSATCRAVNPPVTHLPHVDPSGWAGTRVARHAARALDYADFFAFQATGMHLDLNYSIRVYSSLQFVSNQGFSFRSSNPSPFLFQPTVSTPVWPTHCANLHKAGGNHIGFNLTAAGSLVANACTQSRACHANYTLATRFRPTTENPGCFTPLLLQHPCLCQRNFVDDLLARASSDCPPCTSESVDGCACWAVVAATAQIVQAQPCYHVDYGHVHGAVVYPCSVGRACKTRVAKKCRDVVVFCNHTYTGPTVQCFRSFDDFSSISFTS